MTDTIVTSPPTTPTLFRVRIEHLADEVGRGIPGTSGAASIDGAFLVLHVKTPRRGLFFPLFYRMAEIRLPLRDVLNVARRENVVSFGRWTVPGARRTEVAFQNPQEAAFFAAHMPATTTTEFLQQNRETNEFVRALNVATPRLFVTRAIIALNVLMYIVVGLSGAGWFEPNADRMLAWGANYGPRTLNGEYWRLLTAAFLHFGALHIFCNMWALYAVGALVERLFGSGVYATIYLVAAVFSSAVATYWTPTALEVGASGAIFGVYGALLAYLLCQRESFPRAAAPQLLKSTLFFIGFNALYGAAIPAISNSAHIGGLVAGFALGAAMGRPLDAVKRMRQAKWRLLAGGVVIAALSTTAGTALARLSRDPHSELALRDVLEQVLPADARISARLHELEKQYHAGNLNDEELAAAISTDLIDRWNDALGLLQRVTHSENALVAKGIDEFIAETKQKIDRAEKVVSHLQEHKHNAAASELMLLRMFDDLGRLGARKRD